MRTVFHKTGPKSVGIIALLRSLRVHIVSYFYFAYKVTHLHNFSASLGGRSRPALTGRGCQNAVLSLSN